MSIRICGGLTFGGGLYLGGAYIRGGEAYSRRFTVSNLHINSKTVEC